jgi:hypothetical protein
LAYILRPRVVRTGPREFVVALYVLDTGVPGAPSETHFAARVERTGTRARHAMQEMVAAATTELDARGVTEIVRDDAQALAVLSRVK